MTAAQTSLLGKASQRNGPRHPALRAIKQKDAPPPRFISVPATTAPLFVFLHIPKTAGTTMRAVFKKMFQEHYYMYEGRTRDKAGVNGKFAYERPEFFDNILLLAGHLSRFSPIVRAITDRRVVFISIVRDPVERVVSYYDYLRRNRGHPFFDDVKDSTLLESFSRDGLFRRACVNEQLRVLFGARPNFTPSMMLQTNNYVVSTIKQLDELATVVSGLSGMTRPREIPRYNTTPSLEKGGILLAKEQPDFEEAIQVITSANAMEDEFYRRVQRAMIVNLPGWLPSLGPTAVMCGQRDGA